jgi:small nuclear ribonucleoprotein E
MTGRGGGGGGRGKVLLPPINFIFKLLQQRSTVSIWLYEQLAIRIEGKIRVHLNSRWTSIADTDIYTTGF